MPVRLVALDEGPDIQIGRGMVVVGRHPQCDTRLDSIRVSRRHCCMDLQPSGELEVRDLGSTNGIRINGQRVERGRLKSGDELAIAHIRYRLEDGSHDEATLAESAPDRFGPSESPAVGLRMPSFARPTPAAEPIGPDNPLAAAVRELLPAHVADRCRIQVIVKMDPEEREGAEECPPDSSP